jgi:hypothetical protein
MGDFLPGKDEEFNKDGCWFVHYIKNDYDYEELIAMFNRRFERLNKLIDNNERVLFLYTGEGEIYNILKNRGEHSYEYLKN